MVEGPRNMKSGRVTASSSPSPPPSPFPCCSEGSPCADKVASSLAPPGPFQQPQTLSLAVSVARDGCYPGSRGPCSCRSGGGCGWEAATGILASSPSGAQWASVSCVREARGAAASKTADLGACFLGPHLLPGLLGTNISMRRIATFPRDAAWRLCQARPILPGCSDTDHWFFGHIGSL